MNLINAKRVLFAEYTNFKDRFLFHVSSKEMGPVLDPQPGILPLSKRNQYHSARRHTRRPAFSFPAKK